MLAVAFHGVRGHRDDGQVGTRRAFGRADQAGRLEPAHLRHLHVHQHDVEVLSLERRERFASVGGDRHGVAAPLEQAGGQPLVDQIVLGQQHVEAPLGQLRRAG